MTRRHWAIVVLFIAPFILGSLYLLFDSKKMFTPWLDRRFKYRVSVQYYVDELCDQLIGIVYVGMTMLFRETKRYTVICLAARVSFVYVCIDLVMFMVNHNNATSYIFTYSCVGAITILIYWIMGEWRKLKEIFEQTKHQMEIYQ